MRKMRSLFRTIGKNMKIGNFEILLSSRPDKEYLVAEITFDNMYWVEISHEEEEMKIHFYPHPNLTSWEFKLDEALEVLAEAKKKMLALGPKN
ncbi:MAG: hypothetical protein S4CHLAM7_12380 [Chlamydiae bacterium]|nr:hypothetical protein [Chlamydiota bacterium]